MYKFNTLNWIDYVQLHGQKNIMNYDTTITGHIFIIELAAYFIIVRFRQINVIRCMRTFILNALYCLLINRYCYNEKHTSDYSFIVLIGILKRDESIFTIFINISSFIFMPNGLKHFTTGWIRSLDMTFEILIICFWKVFEYIL